MTDRPFYLPQDKQQDDVAAKERLELRDVLDTASGRSVFKRLLESAGVFRGIEAKNADVYRLAALQAFGLERLDEMYRAHSGAAMGIVNELMAERTRDA